MAAPSQFEVAWMMSLTELDGMPLLDNGIDVRHSVKYEVVCRQESGTDVSPRLTDRQKRRAWQQLSLRNFFLGVTVLALLSWALAGFLRRTVSWHDYVLVILEGHDTVYAKGYSDDHWQKIRIGMNEHTVTELLGEPIAIHLSKATKVLAYSAPGTRSENYHLRLIRISNGRVTDVLARFELD